MLNSRIIPRYHIQHIIRKPKNSLCAVYNFIHVFYSIYNIQYNLVFTFDLNKKVQISIFYLVTTLMALCLTQMPVTLQVLAEEYKH